MEIRIHDDDIKSLENDAGLILEVLLKSFRDILRGKPPHQSRVFGEAQWTHERTAVNLLPDHMRIREAPNLSEPEQISSPEPWNQTKELAEAGTQQFVGILRLCFQVSSQL